MARFEWLGPLREPTRGALFKTLSRALATDDGRRLRELTA